jgi:hypothetical protein
MKQDRSKRSRTHRKRQHQAHWSMGQFVARLMKRMGKITFNFPRFPLSLV